MDRVGGYKSYVALLEDAHAFDDVVTVMMGEADAQKILRMQNA